MISQFARDIDKGLSSHPKFLSSRYFYDAQGDKLFQDIMRSPDYYLTNCEYEIFDRQKADILKVIDPGRSFKLVELGAGNGYKTKLLLEHLWNTKADFEYFPVDISHAVLEELEADLLRRWPGLKVNYLNCEYLAALDLLNKPDDSPKTILFLGSNIGNFSPENAKTFFQKLNSTMSPGDKLLSGIDLKKDPYVILRAYNDRAGITRAFNLNLLTRINRELGANFRLENFQHYPTYDPVSGEARSYLMSQVEQEVFIQALGKTYFFDHSEPVHMEISRKFSLKEIEALAGETGFTVQQHFTDSREYFVDTLWVKQ